MNGAGPADATGAPGGRDDEADADPAGGPTRHDDLGRLARGGTLNFAGSLVNALGNFALVLIITAGLGRSTAGAFLEAIAMFQILAITGQLGADTGLARFIPADITRGREDRIRAVDRIVLVPVVLVGVVVATVAWALAVPLGDLVTKGGSTTFVDVFRVFAPFVPVVAAYTVLHDGTRAFGTMTPSVAVERVGRALVQPAAVLVAVAAGLSTTAVAAAWIGPYAAAVVPLTVWYFKLVRKAERRAATRRAAADEPTPPPTPLRPIAGRFWAFAIPRAVAGVFQVAVLYLDVLLVGALAGARNAAVYAASSRWLVAGLFVTLAVNQAFQPQISALLASGALERARSLFQTSTAWVVALVWPVYLTLVVFGGVLVQVFGRGYSSGGPVLAILAVAGMLGSGAGPVDMVLLMGGRSRANLFNSLAALVVNVGANLVLIPAMGVAGAAVAWTLSIVTTNGLALFQVHRRVGIHPFGAAWVRIAPATLVIVGGLLLLSRLLLGSTPAGLVVGVLVAGAAHLLVLRRLSGRLDVAALRQALTSRGNRRRTGVAVPAGGAPS